MQPFLSVYVAPFWVFTIGHRLFLPLSGHQPSPFDILPRSLFEHGKYVLRSLSQQSGFLNSSVQQDRRGLDV